MVKNKSLLGVVTMHSSKHKESSFTRLPYLLVSPGSIKRDNALLTTALHITFDHDSLPFIQLARIDSLYLEAFELIIKLVRSPTETVQPSFVEEHHCHRELLVDHFRHILSPHFSFKVEPLTRFEDLSAIKSSATIYVIPHKAHAMCLSLLRHEWLWLYDACGNIKDKSLVAIFIEAANKLEVVILPRSPCYEKFVIHNMDDFGPVFLKLEFFILNV